MAQKGIKAVIIVEFRGLLPSEFNGKIYHSMKVENDTFDMMISVPAECMEEAKSMVRGETYEIDTLITRYDGKLKVRFNGIN